MDQFYLAERDGWVYIRWVMIDYQQPRRITHWMPVGLRLAGLAQWFQSDEAAQARIGTELTRVPHRSDQFKDGGGLTFGLESGGETRPTFTQEEAIPPPKQRGKVLPVEWRRGAWFKLTSKGWVLA